MRDLLFLAHRIPFPPDKGDKIRSFHILKHLSSSFRIHLGCFADGVSDFAAIGALKELCADVFCLPLRPADKMMRSVQAFTDGKAISEAIYFDQGMAEWVAERVTALSMADAFVFCSVMFPYVAPYAGTMRIVLDIVDVDSEKWGAYSKAATWPLSAVYRREQVKIRELEEAGARAADISLFVSSAEAECFGRIAPELRARTDFLQNGVDFGRFCSDAVFPSPFPAGTAPIVFTGMMDYRPNVDAVEWFAHEVLPLVRGVHPNAAFWIVGAKPATRVSRLAVSNGVHVTGYVSDVRPHIANAACIVAPLQIARGVQNKVLEAMAMGKPAVVTPAALEGISAIPDEEILVAEGAAGFADAVAGVLSGKSETIGRNARRRAEADYNWTHTFTKLDEIMAASLSPAQNVSPKPN
ncbi:MAG TPA: TIGR03087 family PEP-CTERM/XrtA system glycosyltransferase [Rhizomicrobium sp.]|nr:TIGR03087 family PEP-CTERM/XrtA system glycosyltransferase [Rhizomicrobium sp.]